MVLDVLFSVGLLPLLTKCGEQLTGRKKLELPRRVGENS
jgi:hypothetical protein